MTVGYAKTAPTISASHHTSTHNKKNQTSLLVKFYTYAIPALLARIWCTNLTLSRKRHRHSFHFLLLHSTQKRFHRHLDPTRRSRTFYMCRAVVGWKWSTGNVCRAQPIRIVHSYSYAKLLCKSALPLYSQIFHGTTEIKLTNEQKNSIKFTYRGCHIFGNRPKLLSGGHIDCAKSYNYRQS